MLFLGRKEGAKCRLGGPLTEWTAKVGTAFSRVTSSEEIGEPMRAALSKAIRLSTHAARGELPSVSGDVAAFLAITTRAASKASGWPFQAKATGKPVTGSLRAGDPAWQRSLFSVGVAGGARGKANGFLRGAEQRSGLLAGFLIFSLGV